MKKKLSEAQVQLSIQDLSSSDLQTLSQILSLAGQAEQSAGLMSGMGGMTSGAMGGDPLQDAMDEGAGPMAMAGPDASYGTDGAATNDEIIASGDDFGIGADVGMGDDLGIGADLDADPSMNSDMDMGSDLDMGGDEEFDLSMDDMGEPAAEDDGFDLSMDDIGAEEESLEESFARMFSLAGLNESEEEDDEDEEMIEESSPIVVLDLNDPKVQDAIQGGVAPAPNKPFSGIDAPVKSEINPHHPGMEPGEEVNLKHTGMTAPSPAQPAKTAEPVPAAPVSSVPATHPGMGSTVPPSDLEAAGVDVDKSAPTAPAPKGIEDKAAKPSWMSEMREDMDFFEDEGQNDEEFSFEDNSGAGFDFDLFKESEEETEGEVIEESEAMYDFSLDEDAVEELGSVGLGDNRLFGPYQNEMAAMVDARQEIPGAVDGQDVQLQRKPDGFYWSKINNVCESEEAEEIVEEEDESVEELHQSLNEQFERFLKGL